jgi:hypothetical protein
MYVIRREVEFKASSKAGKHFVPVRISYFDEEWKQQTVEKLVEYTVAEELQK